MMNAIRTRIMRKSVVTPVLLAGLGLALGACESPLNNSRDALLPRERFPITVSPEQSELKIAVPANKTNLSRDEKAAIRAFYKQYAAIGHGPLTAAVPMGGANSQAANTLLAEIDTELVAAGLAAHGLDAKAYRSEGGDAPVVLSFTRFIATPSPCGHWDENFGFAPSNEPTANFGCAQQHNLAVMVADPMDLVQPRTINPAESNRRSTVLGKYRAGEVTSADRSEQEKGTISEVTD